MASITIPSFGGDDLYLYMREIVQEEFPKALRQACKPLWDEKRALGNGLWHHSSPMYTSLVSKPLEKLDFCELCRIMTNARFPRFASRYHPYPIVPSYVLLRDPALPNRDKSSVASAIDKLRDLKEQYVDINGYTSPQLLRQQLAQARGAFMTLGVTLNDSRNGISFSAAGLQDLIPKDELSPPESPSSSSDDEDELSPPESPSSSSDDETTVETSSKTLFSLEGVFYRIGRVIKSLESRSRLFLEHEYVGAFSSEQERRDVKIWIKGKYLGGGNFGKVFSLTHRESGIKVAMKEVKMEPQYSKMPEEVKQLQNEIEKLSRLRHPRIVRFLGSEQKGDVIYLFLDFMAGGSLHDFIRQRGKLDERLTRKFTQQILEGVDYLHSNEITHRDIKGPNILLDSDRSVKLADFGVSRKIQKIGTKTDLTSYVGTTYWMAPEILWGEGYGRKVDIWSVGCTVVEMLTGNPPLKNLEPQAAMFRIGSKPLEVKLPKGATKEARDFVRAALTWKPEKRPKCKELLTHPFVEIRKKS